MTISVGDALPQAQLLVMGEGGPETVDLSERLKGRRVVVFGLPGAFTGVCSTSHVPSFMRARDALAAKGVDDIICVSVNDPFVMDAWSKSTGASEAGLSMLADPQAGFVKALGLDFTAPGAGLIDRSKRFALVAEDGVVKVLQIEDNPGACSVSSGDAIVEAI